MNARIFGQNVHRLRMGLGKTQEEFAEAIEVSRTYLQSIESGKANPTIVIAERITKVCKCSWNDLMQNTDCPDSVARHKRATSSR